MSEELDDLRKRIEALEEANRLRRKQIRELQQQARRPIWSRIGFTKDKD